MKRKLLFLFFALSFLFISCSKKTDDVVYPITGLWAGTYTSDDGGQQPPLYYSFDIRSDSTIVIQGHGNDGVTYYSYGTWSISGSSFSSSTVTKNGFNGNNSGVTETTTAIFSNKGKLDGVWKTIYHTGKFTLERTN